ADREGDRGRAHALNHKGIPAHAASGVFGASTSATFHRRSSSIQLIRVLDPVDAAADCELIQQIRQKVLPLFATRCRLQLHPCERRHLLVGATRLTPESWLPTRAPRRQPTPAAPRPSVPSERTPTQKAWAAI